jgi:tellurium resistance protein TerD
MGVSLEKGEGVSLSKGNPDLEKIYVDIEWEETKINGHDCDLDISVFLLSGNDKVSKDDDFVFYNHSSEVDGAVFYTGDDRTGGGDEEDERVEVDLVSLRNNGPEIKKLAFTATIHDAAKLGQNFGQIEGASVRVVDMATDQEIVRYDLTEDYSVETAITVGEIVVDESLRFNALGESFEGGLRSACKTYGVNVG